MTAIRIMVVAVAVMLSAIMPLSASVPNHVADTVVTQNSVVYGLVKSGSVEFSMLPAKARKFLQKYCDGNAVLKCEKEYATGIYTIVLAQGLEMRFNNKGDIIGAQAPSGYCLSPTLLKSSVNGKLYKLLEHNGFKSCVESVRHDSGKGYILDIADPVLDKVYYGRSGMLTLIVER